MAFKMKGFSGFTVYYQTHHYPYKWWVNKSIYNNYVIVKPNNHKPNNHKPNKPRPNRIHKNKNKKR